MRRISAGLLESARNSAILAEFNRALANMPRKKVLALHQQTSGEADAVSARLKATEGEIEKLRGEIQELTKKNVSLGAKARDLRDRSNKASGQQGYDLLTAAHKVEREMNGNSGQVAARQDRIKNLNEDQTMQQGRLRAVRGKLDALKKRLDSMDERSAEATRAMKQAHTEAAGNLQEAGSAAAEVLQACRRLLAEERLALEALGSAEKHLGDAEASIRAERDAAKKTERKQDATSEILRDLADDKHLASTVALKASASLTLADVLQSQLNTAKSNAALAKDLTDVAGKLGQQAPPAAGQLKSYLPDRASVQSGAIEKYRAAEKDLEGILDAHLKTGIGRNIRWVYQAQLADTYYGHFRMTGDTGVLMKARGFVTDALAGKERSPYLASVLNLKALLDRAESKQP